MKNYINGQWVATTGSTEIAVINPRSEQALAHFIAASPHDVDAAVEAANQALASWSNTSAAERAAWLNKIADAIQQSKIYWLNYPITTMASRLVRPKSMSITALNATATMPIWYRNLRLVKPVKLITARNSLISKTQWV